MIKRIYEEKRKYYNTENGLIKSQKGFREFRIFGIRVSRRNFDFSSDSLDEKKAGVGFNSK